MSASVECERKTVTRVQTSLCICERACVHTCVCMHVCVYVSVHPSIHHTIYYIHGLQICMDVISVT